MADEQQDEMLARLAAEMPEAGVLAGVLADNDEVAASVAIQMDHFSIRPCSDGYTWLCCMACAPEGDEDGTALLCIHDACPMSRVMEKIFGHALECQPGESDD